MTEDQYAQRRSIYHQQVTERECVKENSSYNQQGGRSTVGRVIQEEGGKEEEMDAF